MKHLKAVNSKAGRVLRYVGDTSAARGDGAPPAQGDVVALQGPGGGAPQQAPAHIPLGCSLAFSPGWEADRSGGTAGLCQPVERDIYDCWLGCFWPAQVPDQLNHSPTWTASCATAQKDWRKMDIVFP
jgi:Quinohemoprotein amine dehydrogenase, gamma subunit